MYFKCPTNRHCTHRRLRYEIRFIYLLFLFFLNIIVAEALCVKTIHICEEHLSNITALTSDIRWGEHSFEQQKNVSMDLKILRHIHRGWTYSALRKFLPHKRVYAVNKSSMVFVFTYLHLLYSTIELFSSHSWTCCEMITGGSGRGSLDVLCHEEGKGSPGSPAVCPLYQCIYTYI